MAIHRYCLIPEILKKFKKAGKSENRIKQIVKAK